MLNVGERCVVTFYDPPRYGTVLNNSHTDFGGVNWYLISVDGDIDSYRHEHGRYFIEETVLPLYIQRPAWQVKKGDTILYEGEEWPVTFTNGFWNGPEGVIWVGRDFDFEEWGELINYLCPVWVKR